MNINVSLIQIKVVVYIICLLVTLMAFVVSEYAKNSFIKGVIRVVCCISISIIIIMVYLILIEIINY